MTERSGSPPFEGGDAPLDLGAARALVRSGRTRPAAFRKRALGALARMLKRHEAAWLAALESDLGKSAFESWATEIGLLLGEIRAARSGLARWSAPRRAPSPAVLWPATATVEPEPVGVVLVIAPWNYPLQLSLAPVASAVAAGNAAVVKPSELAPATGAALARLLPEAFPDGLVQVVRGGPETGDRLVRAGFDHVVFTGSRETARRISEAAAATLAPLTLELGGKCPAVVEASANVRLAARRIAWGKFLNAGQTCVAPDYVLAHASVAAAFTERLGAEIRTQWGERPNRNPDYARIVSAGHWDRLDRLASGLPVLLGGERDRDSLRFAPTVAGPPPPGHPTETEEVFGPILSVIPYGTDAEAEARLALAPDPLAAYVFTRKRRPGLGFGIRSGAVVLNDVAAHCAHPGLPFGGAGRSGYGPLHGAFGFARLSRQRAVFRGARLDLPVRYPPYAGKLGLLRRLLGG